MLGYLFFATFVVLFVFWVLLSSFFDALHLVAGILCSLLVASTSYKLLRPGKNIRTFTNLILYIPWLLYKIVIANLDVAYRALHPKMPIDPRIVEFKSVLKSDLSLTTLANSITLTPGTITVDVKDRTYLVHALTSKAAEELLKGDMQARVARVYMEG